MIKTGGIVFVSVRNKGIGIIDLRKTTPKKAGRKNNLKRILWSRGITPMQLIPYCVEEDVPRLYEIINSDHADPIIQTAVGIAEGLELEIDEIWETGPGEEDYNNKDD